VSDTPKTDAKAIFFGWNPEEGEEFVQADFARELERENAVLRADKERLDWLLTPMGSTVCYGHLRDNFTLTRAAIDAARKEQP